jgi:hypothetical protein
LSRLNTLRGEGLLDDTMRWSASYV